jgi:colanic acid/amylovoran biosynthesis glycosyltransferase
MSPSASASLESRPRGRVALFCSRFLPYSQTFIYEEIRAHTRYQVEVFCHGRENQQRFPFEPVHVAGALYRRTTYSPRFHRVFKRRPFDLVHAHFGPAGTFAMRYARAHALPLAVTFHGYDVPLLTSAGRFRPARLGYALLGPRMLQRMDLGLCASNELRELLIEQGVPEHKLVVHRLGVDLATFRPGPARTASPVRVLMVGRLVDKKGFRYGVRAFAQVRAVHPGVELHIVGDGALRQPLEALTRELGAAGVSFLGSLPPAEVLRELQQAHVLLAPSVTTSDGDRESGLIVAKEASACGVVPIGTYHGGIHEIIDDGKTGFLVPERAVEALAARLEALVRDAPMRDAMASAARTKMEHEYDQRERVAALESHYDALVRGRLVKS